MTDQPRGLDALLQPVHPLGATERGILLAAEREAHPATWWGAPKPLDDSDPQVLVSLDRLVEILERSSDLTRTGGAR